LLPVCGTGGFGGSVIFEPFNIAHVGQPGEVGQVVTIPAGPTAFFW
jgi:hypothetical protein